MIPYEDPPRRSRRSSAAPATRDFAEILMLARTAEPLGSRRYWPIFAKALEVGLPSASTSSATAAIRSPARARRSYYIEEMTAHSAACQAGVASLALQAVFERFPA